MKNTIDKFMDVENDKRNKFLNAFQKENWCEQLANCGSMCGRNTLEKISLFLFFSLYLVFGFVMLVMDIQTTMWFKEGGNDADNCRARFGDDSTFVKFLGEPKHLTPETLTHVLLGFNLFYLLISIIYFFISLYYIVRDSTIKEAMQTSTMDQHYADKHKTIRHMSDAGYVNHHPSAPPYQLI
jgi:hypothetical protein